MFWRELPNYNPVAVKSAIPGVDHAAAAEALFKPTNEEDGNEPEELEGEVLDKDDYPEDDDNDDKAAEILSVDNVPMFRFPTTLATSAPTSIPATTTPPLLVVPKSSKLKAVLGGRDAGIIKANTN
ncbi:hypothetical protein C0991_006797, partial [Blastosporella zonata]